MEIPDTSSSLLMNTASGSEPIFRDKFKQIMIKKLALEVAIALYTERLD